MIDWKVMLALGLVIFGVGLILHHGIVYHKWFDTSDWIGHDWYGVILVLIGIIVIFASKPIKRIKQIKWRWFKNESKEG